MLNWLSRRLLPRQLLLTCVFLTMLPLVTLPESDPDFWWQWLTGKWILAHRALPSHDLYSYTVPSHVWVLQEWLSQIVIAAISGYGLWTDSVLFGAVTLAGLYFIYRAGGGKRQPYVIAAAVLTLSVIIPVAVWGPRSQMYTFTFTALLIYWLLDYLDGRGRQISYFPLIMLLWSNLEAGFMIGFVFLGIAMFAESVTWLGDRRNQKAFGHLRHLGLVTVGSVIAVALNPNGWRTWTYPIETILSRAQQRFIVEWQSPNFHQLSMRPLEFSIVVFLVIFAISRPSLFEWLLVACTMVLTLDAARMLSLYVAASMPVLSRRLTWWWDNQAADWKRKVSRHVGTTKPSGTMTVASLLVIVAVSALMVWRTALPLTQESQLVSQDFPVSAANYLAHHDLKGRMFNQYDWGGYLAYRFYPRRKVFIFGEAELMGDPLIFQYNDVASLAPNWYSILNRYRVNYVVFNRGLPLSEVLARMPSWQLCYRDKLAVIYVRGASCPATSR